MLTDQLPGNPFFLLSPCIDLGFSRSLLGHYVLLDSMHDQYWNIGTTYESTSTWHP